MPHIAIIPADATRPVSVTGATEDVDLSALIHADMLDHIHFGHQGFDMVVDDVGTLVEAPVNERADRLAKASGRHPDAAPISGDVVLLGVDQFGDWTDLPIEVVMAVSR